MSPRDHPLQGQTVCVCVALELRFRLAIIEIDTFRSLKSSLLMAYLLLCVLFVSLCALKVLPVE